MKGLPGLGMSNLGTGAARLAQAPAALLLLLAFFAASEFALIRLRPTRVQLLEADGERGARAVARLQRRLRRALLATQPATPAPAGMRISFIPEPSAGRRGRRQPGVRWPRSAGPVLARRGAIRDSGRRRGGLSMAAVMHIARTVMYPVFILPYLMINPTIYGPRTIPIPYVAW